MTTNMEPKLCPVQQKSVLQSRGDLRFLLRDHTGVRSIESTTVFASLYKVNCSPVNYYIFINQLYAI